MIERILLVFCLIISSIRYRTRPWNFFQLNRHYFDSERKIFSKQRLNQTIPERYRLRQVIDDGSAAMDFPCFGKPEWGQNSRGVLLITDSRALRDFRQNRDKRLRYLLQQAAPGKREFEIFYVRKAGPECSSAAVFSVTETINSSGEKLVINGVHNPATSYRDITDILSPGQRKGLWRIVSDIGEFRVARLGVRADSVENLLAGQFHVIEVNIFLPMPLALLDPQHRFFWKLRFCLEAMDCAARLAAEMDFTDGRKAIFFHHLNAHYRVKP